MRPFKSTSAQNCRFCPSRPSPPPIPARSSRPPTTSKHYSNLKFAEVMQSSLSQNIYNNSPEQNIQNSDFNLYIVAFCVNNFFGPYHKPEFSTCATFLEPPCHVKKRGFHILLQDIFLICFSTQNNENKFFIF